MLHSTVNRLVATMTWLHLYMPPSKVDNRMFGHQLVLRDRIMNLIHRFRHRSGYR
jgi:hypothetical protein